VSGETDAAGSSDAGLTDVPLAELRQLQRALEAGRLTVPVSAASLQAAGLDATAEACGAFAGLDRAGVVAVLRVAIAERSRRPLPRVSLVWTGPDTRASRSRDTAVVVRELFESARRSVLIAGFWFWNAKEIFKPLGEQMRRDGVEVSLFVDLGQYLSQSGTTVETALSTFMRESWNPGDPAPGVFYDPRPSAESRVKLHAKCIVVDERRVLITSANFTDRAQTRNVEVGAFVEDPELARTLVAQWTGLVDAGVMVRAPASV
jgi:phosphatidylserine/phosphatidylglycerophosphate/cardiolipin synthase-like enzyme